MPNAIVDTNVLVAMVDGRDNWHIRTENFIEQLEREQNMQLVYFDCVLNETLSVLGRRLEEQKRLHEFIGLVERVQTLIPDTLIVWVSSDIRRLYAEIITLMKQTSGKLNFHDALIALKCRELNIESILSFDKDFDQIDWVKRIS
jgi:predicted nucleic acid-binding protein